MNHSFCLPPRRLNLALQYAATRWKAALLIVVLDLVAGLLNLLLPLLVAQTYAHIFQLQSRRGQLLAQWGIPAQSLPWLEVLLAVIALKALLDFWRKYRKGLFGEDCLNWLREKLFTHHLQLEWSVYQKSGASKFLMRFSGDLQSIQQYLNKGCFQFSADVVLLVVGLALLFALHWTIGAVVVGLSLINAVGVWWFNRQLAPLETARRDQKAQLLALINQLLLQIITIKVFNRQKPAQQQLQRRVKRLRQMAPTYYGWSAGLQALAPWSNQMTLWLIMAGAALSQKNGSGYSGEVLFAGILLLLTWKAVLNRLLQVGLVWKKGTISLRKIQGLLEKPQEPQTGSLERNFQPQKIIAQDLTWQPTQPAPLDLVWRQGETLHLPLPAADQVALVELLTRLRTPQGGTLQLDGRPYAAFHPATLRRQLALVSPLVPLRGRTLLESLSYSPRHYEKTHQQWQEWQRLFSPLATLDLNQAAHEGSNLTPTQQQLLQWLRASLTRKPFLVLHEAFAHLNPTYSQQLLDLMTQRTKPPGILILQENGPD